MKLLEGKKVLIFGIANDKSIAYGIAKQLRAHGAEIGISYAGQILEKRVVPIAKELGSTFVEECDLGDDVAIDTLFDKAEKHFGKLDVVVHSVAFAPREALVGRYVDTDRDGFLLTMNISVFTLLAVAKRAEKLLNENGSIITMTYYGGEKYVENYNVMGVAKAALDSSLHYLATDLGVSKSIRVNAISAGPIRTLAASGIGSFKSIFSLINHVAPLRRTVDTTDCGNAAVFLASDLSTNITGEVIHVDAGFNTIGIHSAMSPDRHDK